MQLNFLIAPSGRLLCELDRATDPAWSECLLDGSLAEDVSAAFGESSASGLLYLVAIAHTSALSLPLVFWRNWSRRIVQSPAKLDEERFEQLEAWVRLGTRLSGSAPTAVS
ncbi:MAG UNVERIFIED_CONTAM: hypothetical protein LVR18_41215 [Planctomycetaceae bacterium]|jgi:hypothetical protein